MPERMKRIYLDHAAMTPVDPRVVEFASRYLINDVGNPSSLHSVGQETRRAIQEARLKVARLINAEDENCIIFTSCATESNNLAIKGTALRNAGKGKKLAASAIEHISVLNPMKELQKNGFELNIIPVDTMGVVDLRILEEILSSEVVVTSVMYANNEIGTTEPIGEISEIVHRKGNYLHVDATAAAGRIPIDVQKDGIDLLTVSSNDLGGPQGAAALYVKPGVKLQTILPGGGQENGLRSGTENAFAIAGMGEAAAIADEEMGEESEQCQGIRDQLIEEILKMDDTILTGHPSQRLPHHASFIFRGVEGESVLLNLDAQYNIQVSTGSACSSQTYEPSHVLSAIGVPAEDAHSSIVLTLGRANKAGDFPVIVKAVKDTVGKLRQISGG